MNKTRLATSFAFLAGTICLCAAPGSAYGDKAARSAPQAPTAPSDTAQRTRQTAAAGDDDFAGLDLTAEQKAQFAKIRESSDAKKALVAKDTKLSPDQKDAFILGYTRMEYGEMYKVLTPIQQKQVRKKMADRHAAEKAAHPKQGPPKQPQN